MKNPFKRKEKKVEKKKPKLDKKNLKAFLEEVSKAVDANFSGQESNNLENVMKSELDNWLKATIEKNQPLDVISVKVGVCLGILESLRKINEVEEKERVTYIA